MRHGLAITPWYFSSAAIADETGRDDTTIGTALFDAATDEVITLCSSVVTSSGSSRSAEGSVAPLIGGRGELTERADQMAWARVNAAAD